jgi:hypothetical protein
MIENEGVQGPLPSPPKGERLSFVAREIERVETAMLEAGISPCRYAKLYAINQALGWALDPGQSLRFRRLFGSYPSAVVLRYLRPLCVATITQTELPPTDVK